MEPIDGALSVTSNRDIWIVANQCIQQHGEDATVHAATRADELLAEGDMDGRLVWLRVLDAIKELQNTETDRVH